MNKCVSMSDLSNPLSCFFTKTYPNKTIIVTGSKFFVASILRRCSLSQISSSIVECVVIFVIRFFFWITFKNLSCHLDYMVFAFYDFPTSSVKTVGLFTPLRVPIELVEVREVCSSDHRALALRKGNYLVGWVEWLRNRVAFYRTLLGHESSAIGLVQRSHFSMGWR